MIGGSNAGNAGILRDILIERNFMRILNNHRFVSLEYDDVTIRDNIIFDTVGGSGNPKIHIFADGDLVPQRVHIYNNTIYINHSISNAQWRWTDDGNHGNCQAGDVCKVCNNLLYAPNYSAAAPTMGTNWNDCGGSNYLAASANDNPFGGPIPGQGLTQRGDFLLDPTNTNVTDAGYSLANETDFWVHLDAGSLCRDARATDIGAHESGGSVCFGNPLPPASPPDPPTLLP